MLFISEFRSSKIKTSTTKLKKKKTYKSQDPKADSLYQQISRKEEKEQDEKINYIMNNTHIYARQKPKIFSLFLALKSKYSRKCMLFSVVYLHVYIKPSEHVSSRSYFSVFNHYTQFVFISCLNRTLQFFQLVSK